MAYRGVAARERGGFWCLACPYEKPALFPFEFGRLNSQSLEEDARLEFYHQGLDEDLVTLRAVKGGETHYAVSRGAEASLAFRRPSALLQGCCTRVRLDFEVLANVSHITCKCVDFLSERCWARTSDLCRVKADP